jgi:hypothetical protein
MNMQAGGAAAMASEEEKKMAEDQRGELRLYLARKLKQVSGKLNVKLIVA